MSEWGIEARRDRGARRGEVIAVALLQLAYWVAFQFVFYIYSGLSEGAALEPSTLLVRTLLFIARPIELMVVFVGALLCVGIYLVSLLERDRSFAAQLALSLAATLLATLAFTAIVWLAIGLYGRPVPAFTLANTILDMMRWIAPIGLWTAIAIALVYNRQVREREARLAEVSIQAHEAQVRALRYQINPHFLHNALNSIAALILDGRNELAEAMVIRLSSFFRTSLAIDPFEDVPLSRELALQRLYLDIERVRFEHLRVEIDVPAELEQALVPSLILQPLVENVLKHGGNDPPAETLLRISARRDGAMRSIEVGDDGPGGGGQSGTAVGLANVRRRLVARFGPTAQLDTSAVPGAGFTARLTMPIAFAPAGAAADQPAGRSAIQSSP